MSRTSGTDGFRRASRRAFLGEAAVGATALLVGCGERGGERGGDEAEEVSPPEDLMREHGVLNRILLIYEEGIRRLESPGGELPVHVLDSAAGIVRTFVEDYHEKLEETQLFPRFERAGTLTELVSTLRAQHDAGRRLTDEVRALLAGAGPADDASRAALAGTLRSFIRMYRPHEAREDTVLFPAIRSIVSPHEFAALGEDFERQEHELFGEDGFERIVDEVAGLERELGIHDLAQFTPAIGAG